MTSRSPSVFPYFFPLGHTAPAVGIVQVRMSVIEPQWVKDVNGQEKAMQDISCKSPYYAIRAHLLSPGTPERRGHQNSILHAGPLLRRVHLGHLRPCHHRDADQSRQHSQQLPLRRYPVVSGHFPVWVRI